MSHHVPDIAHTTMPTAAQPLFTAVTGIPMLIVLGVAMNDLRRDRGPLLLFCFIGGGLAAFFEPVADVLSCLYFPATGQNTAFTALDRPIPWALVFAYPWFVGGQGYLAYRVFAKRVPAVRIWQLWGIFAISNVLVETPGVLTGFHAYYGNQPLNFWGFPLWQAAVQSIMPMAAGALIYALRGTMGNGWKLAAVIPLLPMADGMVNAGLALPIWLTVGSDAPFFVTYLGAAATIGMAAYGIWLLTALLARKPATAECPPTEHPHLSPPSIQRGTD
jgi:hypothetical protein